MIYVGNCIFSIALCTVYVQHNIMDKVWRKIVLLHNQPQVQFRQRHLRSHKDRRSSSIEGTKPQRYTGELWPDLHISSKKRFILQENWSWQVLVDRRTVFRGERSRIGRKNQPTCEIFLHTPMWPLHLTMTMNHSSHADGHIPNVGCRESAFISQIWKQSSSLDKVYMRVSWPAIVRRLATCCGWASRLDCV